jgi:hypothetical protein
LSDFEFNFLARVGNANDFNETKRLTKNKQLPNQSNTHNQYNTYEQSINQASKKETNNYKTNKHSYIPTFLTFSFETYLIICE